MRSKVHENALVNIMAAHFRSRIKRMVLSRVEAQKGYLHESLDGTFKLLNRKK